MAAAQVSTPETANVISSEPTQTTTTDAAEPKSTYDTRAFGDFGWAFVNAGKNRI